VIISAAELLNASILIVDDEVSNIRLLEQMLTDAGYKNISSTLEPNSVSALHHANHYDLILLDLKMPGMDGFEVIESIRSNADDDYLPVIVISAQPDQKLRALQAGAIDFINKPFDLLEVKTRIHNMLEVRLLYRQLEIYNHELEAVALHDALTGLPNRRLLIDRLTLAIAHARRNKQTMAVLFLDLDGFKQINDTLGHDVGDAVLQIIADRLVTTVRQVDTVARFGGDEFVIGLWNLSRDEGLARLMSKLLQVISQPCDIKDHSLSITASIGISLYPQHGEDWESLMKSADRALYEAKRLGKNKYCMAVRTDLLAPMSGDASSPSELSSEANKNAG
jgi:diguanylate cyclase (GGDEF)-like protein